MARTRKKPVWFGFAAEKWKAGMSTTLILDGIMDHHGVNVEYSRLSEVRRLYPEDFPARETATRKDFRTNA